jgi:hypothetical protein
MYAAMKKLHASNRISAVVTALNRGWISTKDAPFLSEDQTESGDVPYHRHDVSNGTCSPLEIKA